MQMKSLLNVMSGKYLKFHQHGPDSRVGKLLEFNDDFLTLLTEEDGVVYYNTQHIKSFSQKAKENQNNNEETGAELNYFSAANFNDLFGQMQYSWVSINEGPEKVEGVLNDFSDDLVSIVSGDEIIHLNPFHIKTISYGLKPKKEEDKEAQENGNERKSNKDNKSDNNKKDQKKNKGDNHKNRN